MFTNIGRSGQQHDEFVPSCLVHTKKDCMNPEKTTRSIVNLFTFVYYRFQADGKTIYPNYRRNVLSYLLPGVPYVLPEGIHQIQPSVD